jgi:transposase
MVALEERFMIREMYRKGVSISEIARRIGRDRKTIRQIVTAPDLAAAKHARQAKACKIDPYAPYLEQRMAEGVLNARKLYGEILAQGYPGKESKVREFVHERRPDKEPVGSVRFETAPGEQGRLQSVRTRANARLFFHGCHRIHIIQFRQHAFPLQRREGRDEKLAVREHREQLITDSLKAFDHVTTPWHVQAIGRNLPGLAAIVRFFDAPMRIHPIGGT